MRKKILLIEDDQPISKAYKDGLRRAGFAVAHIKDGRNAIAEIKRIGPDIILLDLIMPEKNGFEVLEEINKDTEISDLPIIVLSNLYGDIYRERVIKFGINDYLVKADFTVG